MAWRFCPTCKRGYEFDPMLECDERSEFNCLDCVSKGRPMQPADHEMTYSAWWDDGPTDLPNAALIPAMLFGAVLGAMVEGGRAVCAGIRKAAWWVHDEQAG